MRSPSITEQIRAAVDAAGGQAAVVRAIHDAGGTLTAAQLSRLCGGRRPSFETLMEIVNATGHEFRLVRGMGMGESRPATKKK